MSPAEREALRGFVIDVIRVEVANAIKALDREALRGPPGKDGKDINRGELDTMVQFAVGLIPKPKDGEPGKDADPAVIEKMVADAVAKIPAPKDGEPGKDGKDVDPLVIKAIVTEAVASLPPPKDGKDGRDGIGKDGKDGRDGKDGITVDQLKAGLEEMLTKELPDAVTRAVDETLARTPLLTWVGVYEPGKSYVPGNVLTFGGSMWHCNKATTDKPETSDAWSLCVKKGRDFRPPDRK